MQVKALRIPQQKLEYAFTTAPGQIWGVVGSPGSGKTTLLHILAGQRRPDKGKVKDRGKVGVLFQNSYAYPRLSLGEHVRFFTDLHPDQGETIESLVTDLQLREHWDAKARDLAAIVLKRMNLAFALMAMPDLLILDEPFADADPTSLFIMKEVLSTFADQGGTVILSTYGQEAAISFCDHVLYLETGLLESGPTGDEGTDPLASPAPRIAVSNDEAVVLLRPEEILFVQAFSGSAHVTTAEATYDARCSLAMMEDKLARERFFRCHRSTLVNLDQVRSIVPFSKNAFELELKSSSQRVPLSKHRVAELKKRLHW